MAETQTPLMKQYHGIKEKYPDTLLLYRMGDFYELFDNDAVVASKVLGLTLTARNHGGTDKTPLAGFPYHALDRYSARLVKAGHKIAVCEQTEDPKQAKGIVKRDVIEVVTAGTSLDPNFLEEKHSNYLVSVYPQQNLFGLACLELSTGEFFVSQGTERDIANEIARLSPSEILYPDEIHDETLLKSLAGETRSVETPFDGWRFAHEQARQEVLSHFGVTTLDGFGLTELKLAVSAAGGMLVYVKQQKKTSLDHIQSVKVRQNADGLLIDPLSLRNLELLRTTDGETKEGTLVHVLDRTNTSMGARLLRKWLIFPLANIKKIGERHDAVEALLSATSVRSNLGDSLKRISDIERIVGRIGTDRANARDLMALKDTMKLFPSLQEDLGELKSCLLASVSKALAGFETATSIIDGALMDEPPLTLRDGGIIQDGFNTELDNLRMGNREGKEWIASLQPRERTRTGISSLKVGYNKVFGYYLEVSKTNLKMVPEDYIRKQTLVNGERFITPDLKDWEAKVLGAEEKIKQLEYDLFVELRRSLIVWNAELQKAASAIAKLDVLLSLAMLAERQHYVRPIVESSDKIWIEEGRHPVVEFLSQSETFIPNDAALDNKSNQILLITGPNMAGKSTYLRQVALIVLMAQMGSYVPAKKARIGLVDKIFTRIGASDKLSRGQSTFLVEMTEVANILNNATEKSLILLDEVGRGTSTFDGLSIAWAVAEHLHENAKISAKTLFATHYHELAELVHLFPRIKNYNIQVKEWNGKLIFLRKIAEGNCDTSYGIEVAQLAGVPQPVIIRAKEILRNLESMEMTIDHRQAVAKRDLKKEKTESRQQLSLFSSGNVPPSHMKAIESLKETDVNSLTPLQAMQRLAELRDSLTDE